MAVQFHPLTVADIRRETPDAIAITFSVPEDLKPIFLYHHGQYLTVKVDVDGVSHRRNYSLCSSPYDDEPLSIAVKKVNEGSVSSYLNDTLRVGDVLEVYPPMGNFTKELRPDHEQTYVLFGGGSGITPLLSILKSILRVETKSSIVLYYANRDRTSVMFATELDRLCGQYGDRLKIIHVLDVPTEADLAAGAMQGPVTNVIVQDVAGSYVHDGVGVDWFTCGPVGLMDTVIAGLHAAGVDDHRIHREYFTLKKEATDTMENAGQSTAAADEIVTRQVRIRLYGQEHSFTVQPDETILSAASRENLDPPYACQIGACCTCRAKLVTGKVVMDEREALSDDEIAEGYVLTCQSHPLTDDVFADYDQ